MKKLLLVLIALPALSFAVEFNAMAVKPNVLELKKIMTVAGNMEIRYIHDNPRIVIDIAYNSREIHELFKSFKDSDLSKLNCDGDFTLAYNAYGKQFIQINSLKACLDDEDKSVVAHSVGIDKLSDAQVATSSKFITDSLKPTAVVDAKVNDSTLPKVVPEENKKSGVLSGRLSKTAAK